MRITERRAARSCLAAFLALLLAGTCLAGCAREPADREGEAVVELARAVVPEEKNLPKIAVEPEGFGAYLRSSLPAFLEAAAEDGQSQNPVCSPMNLYVCLSMLAETTGGESRQQLLRLLGESDMEAQRTAANVLWQKNEMKNVSKGGPEGDFGISLPAASLWLNEGIPVRQQTADLLAADYFASSFRGKMGSAAYDEAYRTWLDEATGGLLADEIAGYRFDPMGVVTLASTVYYKSRWSDVFDPDETETGVFHAPSGDSEARFMKRTFVGDVWRGAHFSAMKLDLRGGKMVFLLPDEGTDPFDLIRNGEAADFLAYRDSLPWEEGTLPTFETVRAILHVSVPKFDASSSADISAALASLGATDVFDPDRADFTPLIPEDADLSVSPYVSEARHAVRVSIDEEGVEGAALTSLTVYGASEPPPEEIDFVLDRPFVFAVVQWGLPLFAGIVNQP
ncbi:MAG: hypothetical protein E7576_01395 [Ruminococcaceae bacterium]|jgi:serine protease inhibitor|nr:hypothetical protein [Oscillospiraceae bacterium]